jgi:hypothetical protein
MSYLILPSTSKKAWKDREEHCNWRDRESSITFNKSKGKSRLFAKLQLKDSSSKARRESSKRVEEDTKNNP